MPGALQYGNGLKAFAIHLMISQMVALNRVQKQIAAMIGTVIRERPDRPGVREFAEVLSQYSHPWQQGIDLSTA
ncbi:MAG: hypothetical protein CSA21_08535 [Deltaproteobacteria bacterium]|nr:MAG: hypothetical protein CSA21_08535 [Deltaproteobacteria bacterium]